MTASREAIARMHEGGDPWVLVGIGVFSACTACLFVSAPSILIVGLFGALMLAAFIQPDFCVYSSVFLLPWCPLVDLDLPVRDVSLLLHVVVFLGIWTGLARKGKSTREWLWGTKLKKAILVFAGIATVSFLHSPLPKSPDSSRTLILLFSYIGMFFAIDGWLEDRRQAERLLKILLVSTIGVCLFGFCQALSDSYTDLYFQLYPLQDESVPLWSGRITSFLFHFNSLAGYLNLVLPFAIACAALAKDRILKHLGIATAAMGAMAVILTQSRGGLLATAGIVLLAVWLLVPRLTTRGLLLAAGAVALPLLLSVLSSHFQRLQGFDDPEAESRFYVWAAAALLFVAHPILGVGYGNYRFLYTDFNFVSDPKEGMLDAHSVYLQFLSETGVVGFLSFFVMLGLFIAPLLNAFRREDTLSRIVAFGSLGAMTGFLIHGFVDFLFRVSPQFGTLFFIILALGSRLSRSDFGEPWRTAAKTVLA